MNRLRIRRRGAALLPCTLLLVIVLLAMSASLRAVRLQTDIALAHADLQFARDAAEQALAMGKRYLKQSVVAPPPAISGTAAEAGGEQGSSRPVPRDGSSEQWSDDRHQYRIDLLWAADGKRVSRITATGNGRRATTHVSLQSDVELTLCDRVPDPVMPAAKVSSACAVGMREISWRELEGS